MDRKRAVTLRELAGFFLLTALLAAGLLSSRSLNRQHSAMASALEDCTRLVQSGQWTQARGLAENARQAWENNWKIRAVFANHGPMEEIDDLFGQLAIYESAGNPTEFSLVCKSLSLRLDALAGAHCLSWWNVL